jgi:hypothetical protein
VAHIAIWVAHSIAFYAIEWVRTGAKTATEVSILRQSYPPNEFHSAWLASKFKLLPRPMPLDFSSPLHCLQHRNLVCIFDVAADGNSHRDPRDLHAIALELLR